MKGDIRRNGIVKYLASESRPVPAKELAERFSVSRQIIVKDIATLREQGEPITALARGYILEREARPERVFKTIHSDEDVANELYLIIDNGGAVEDVFIYHKVYNKVSAKMDIRSRYDVDVFVAGIKSGKSSLLKNVTAGYHYHTVSAPSEEVLDLIEAKLCENGFVAPLQKHEPMELNERG